LANAGMPDRRRYLNKVLAKKGKILFNKQLLASFSDLAIEKKEMSDASGDPCCECGVKIIFTSIQRERRVHSHYCKGSCNLPIHGCCGTQFDDSEMHRIGSSCVKDVGRFMEVAHEYE
jgi:hypothetical protein